MGVLEMLVPGWDDVNSDRTRRNFQRLNDLFGVVTADSDGSGFSVFGVRVRWGSGSATWTASRDSAVASVAHGMGKTPAFVVPVARVTPIGFVWTGADATNISVQGYYSPGSSISGSFNFNWLAVG